MSFTEERELSRPPPLYLKLLVVKQNVERERERTENLVEVVGVGHITCGLDGGPGVFYSLFIFWIWAAETHLVETRPNYADLFFVLTVLFVFFFLKEKQIRNLKSEN